MKHSLRLAGLVILLLAVTTRSGFADENAAAMVTRIEPADTGIAIVLRDGKREEAAFMMPLFPGDELVVETPNTTVQVKMFGGDDVTASSGQTLKIEAEAEQRGMFDSMLAALSEKVFRNNQVSRRNLVTRSDAEAPSLSLSGFNDGDDVQYVVAGERDLLLRWNLDLDAVLFDIERDDDGQVLIAGESAGDFAFADGVPLQAGQRYELHIAADTGLQASGALVAVPALPDLPPVSPELGTVGTALQLLELAQLDGGRWKFEAIQGVLDLSPDDIDRATLIAEISAL